MAGGLPDHVVLARRAQRDLDAVEAADRHRLIDDIARLARRQLPGEIKKIRALPGEPLQADAGRFRILHLWQGRTLVVLAVFARARAGQVFRGLLTGI